MKRLTASILALGMVAATGAASAQKPMPTYNSRDTRVEGAHYEYARVVRVDPVFTRSERIQRTNARECYREDSYYTDQDEDRGYDNRYRDRGGYADRDSRYRDQDGYGTPAGRNVATVLGGLVGAALGSQVGGGDARYATAAVGSMVGGMAGREIYESNQRNRRQASVTVCDPISDNGRYEPAVDNVSAYDVTYDYAGRQYVTRTDHHPGDSIRVRVDVRAE